MSDSQHLYHKSHYPAHAFFWPRPINEEDSIKGNTFIPTPSFVHRSIVTPPHSGIPTHYNYLHHSNTKDATAIKSVSTHSSSSFQISSATQSASIVTSSQSNTSSVRANVPSSNSSSSANGGGGGCLALILAIFGTIGLLSSVALIFFCCRKKRKSEKFKKAQIQPYKNKDQQQQQQQQPAKGKDYDHHSWASSSTINTMKTAVEGRLLYDTLKTQISQQQQQQYFSSPYPTMSVREKRLTADTLVDETSSLMLKKQYSPQLAFSPSLSADGGMLAVQQQQQSDLSISPSNTLIDNAGALSNLNNEDDNCKSENYYYSDYGYASYPTEQQREQPQKQQLHEEHQTRRKIELYEPQVHFTPSTNDDNPSENIPYPLPHNPQAKRVVDQDDIHRSQNNTKSQDGHEAIQMEN